MEAEQLTLTGEPMAKSGSSVVIKNIPLNKIKISRNSRLSVSDEELAGLMQSIREMGLLQPIGVVATDSGGFEICYGNRRFLAVSKLGMNKIPAIVHKSKMPFDIDMKNLSENVQRRNISPAEVGRYLEFLSESGLSNKEAGVRMGVSAAYVSSCLRAWQEVPEKYRGDLEVKNNGDKSSAQGRGKISITSVNAIASARKRYALNPTDVDKLFKAAKSDSRFSVAAVPKYAAAIASGKKDPLGEIEDSTAMTCTFVIPTKERDRLVRKYVDDGPFKSLTGLFAAILRGEKSERVKLSNRAGI